MHLLSPEMIQRSANFLEFSPAREKKMVRYFIRVHPRFATDYKIIPDPIIPSMGALLLIDRESNA